MTFSYLFIYFLVLPRFFEKKMGGTLSYLLQCFKMTTLAIVNKIWAKLYCPLQFYGWLDYVSTFLKLYI